MSCRAVVITISDRCSAGQAVDQSGPAIIERLASLDAHLVHREIVPDEIDQIRTAVKTWAGRCELMVTTGGTGISRRDVTPEAIEPLIEKHLPGFGEAMRLRNMERTPLSIVSRGGAGITGQTLIVWLPGSPRAVEECLAPIAPAIRHVCKYMRGADPH